MGKRPQLCKGAVHFYARYFASVALRDFTGPPPASVPSPALPSSYPIPPTHHFPLPQNYLQLVDAAGVPAGPHCSIETGTDLGVTGVPNCMFFKPSTGAKEL